MLQDRPAIVWFRDDLRVADHPALYHAASTGCPVHCVYVLDDTNEEIRQLGAAQKWFLHQGLLELGKSLSAIGGRLDIYRGDTEQVITSLAQEIGAMGVYWNRRHGTAEIAQDRITKSRLAESSIEARSFQGNLLHEPYSLKTSNGGPYRVYSPFWRALEKQGEPRMPLPSPEKLRNGTLVGSPIKPQDIDLYSGKPDWAENWEWQPGEQGAIKTFGEFLEGGIQGYNGGRDFPSKQNVSRLSPYLRFGMISPYQIWHGVRHLENTGNANPQDTQKFLKELVWRDFSYHLLFHNPDLAWKNFQKRFDVFPWREDCADDLLAWKKGMTGYPIVDAGMRELWQTGYMHNRVRMIVGSFLVKHLLIHWRHGEAWFWDTLVDGDPANNAASWQWIAGCGADAAPFFRIFNPILQGTKFDPDGSYTRRYVPELSALPDRYLHNPWDCPEEILKISGVELGTTYPRPIIDHAAGRNRALAAFQTLGKVDE